MNYIPIKLLKLFKTHQVSYNSLGRTRGAKRGLSKWQLLLSFSCPLLNAQLKSAPRREPPSLSGDIYHLHPVSQGLSAASWGGSRGRLLLGCSGPSPASAALVTAWVCLSTASHPQPCPKAPSGCGFSGPGPGLLRCWQASRGWCCSLWRRPERGWGPGSGPGHGSWPPCGPRPGPGPASPCREHAAGAGPPPPASSTPCDRSASLEESTVSGAEKTAEDTRPTRSFTDYLTSTYYMPDIVLEAEDLSVNTTEGLPSWSLRSCKESSCGTSDYNDTWWLRWLGDQGRLPKGSTVSAETWKASSRRELTSWIHGHKLKRSQGANTSRAGWG